ncbi:DcrB-related protein [Pantoea phytobeneficialis]|uniref:DcrB-related protein n=1 Tax=Pantoea phytobeneficialis TaxID=2052056 RepID=A0AAP9H778_9GAMM|nr:DcrB-related protein [Pantoea phytobeneficialis]MDO6410124.1 DcrB-related protein [Pantoea phytobeneficialis]QGR07868.1 hypothetical protein CTZ24_16140 [Pantoea phytobeneficialis]
MKTVPFALSEGVLNLPGAVQDHSINVLKFADATLVITRAWDIPVGDEEQYLSQQLAKIKRNMKKVVLGPVVDSDVAGLPAREVALRFENQHVMVYEKLAVARVNDHLLAFTFSRMQPFDADADAFWTAIKAGLQPGG